MPGQLETQDLAGRTGLASRHRSELGLQQALGVGRQMLVHLRTGRVCATRMRFASRAHAGLSEAQRRSLQLSCGMAFSASIDNLRNVLLG
jgi:hypothetical protein